MLQALRVSDGLQAGIVFVNTYNKTPVRWLQAIWIWKRSG